MSNLRVSLTVLLIAASLGSTMIAQTATVPSSGDGTSGNPYQIVTLDNLYWITQNNTEWDMHYIQTANIDASSTSGWDAGSGFLPIGSNATSFTGSYNGAGYSISGLTIARSSTPYVAMFGFISDATIKNVRLTSVSISGNSPVGALVGFCTGSGLSVIDSCSSSGTVIAAGTYLGGLVGSTQAGSTIRNSFSTASAATTNGNYVGGFIGYNFQSSTITNCYSRGSASSTNGNQVGGFAGVNNSATITSCFSTGSASGGGSFVGGFVGAVASSTITNSFWDTNASGNATSNGGTGKTTTEMKTYSTYTDAGWDFVLEETNGANDYWDMDTVGQTVNNGYPFLAWENGESNTLPVQMTELIATAFQSGIELRWRTATEVDNSGWEIERRNVGIVEEWNGATNSPPDRTNHGNMSVVRAGNTQKFQNSIYSASWTKIGFVEGAGTSTSQREYTYVDEIRFSIDYSPFSIHPQRYAYRLKQVDRSGAFSYSGEVEVEVGVAPKEFSLAQNHPNPFNPSTTIEFTVPTDGHATLKIFDVLGREILTLVDGEVEARRVLRTTFDARGLGSGVYLARLQKGDRHLTRKLLLQK